MADATRETASFRVTDTAVTEPLMPFTATVVGMGNGRGLTRGGTSFEPVEYRTRFLVTQDAPDRAIASRSTLSHFSTLRSGALDGAEIEVLRIEDGAYGRVRMGIVPPGGFQVAGWSNVLKRKMVPATRTHQIVAWPGWERPDVPVWFGVRAVDSRGRVSAMSDPVAAHVPAKVGQKGPEQPLLDRPKRAKGKDGETVGPPSGLRVTPAGDGLVRLDWDAAEGDVAGYVLHESESDPATHRGAYVRIAGDGPGLKRGDLVILRKTFYETSRAKVHTNRVWNARENQLTRITRLGGFSDEPEGGLWELRRHPPETPVENGGETYMSIRFDRQSDARMVSYNHSGTGQDWYDVLDPGRTYKIEMWIRGEASRAVGVEFEGFYKTRRENSIGPFSFPVTPEWTRHSYEFTAPRLDEGDRPNAIVLTLNGFGHVDLDNLRIYRADVPYGSPLPEDIERLKASGMSALRTHQLIKTGETTYSMERIARGTLPGVLDITRAVGMVPWLQLEPHLSREEWLGLVEYLAAPYGDGDTPETKPWAALRAADGQVEPWADLFDEIYFEVGNETWNRLFEPWTFQPTIDTGTGKKVSAGKAYGLYHQYVMDIMAESPWWPRIEDKMTSVIGGWNGQRFGTEAAAVAPSADYLTIAAYNGGWDENGKRLAPDPPSFASILSHVTQRGIPAALDIQRDADRLGQRRGRPLLTGTYEAGPGYRLDGLNNAKVSEEEAAGQERIQKSHAAATATLDTFLGQARLGFSMQNFFLYSDGRYWSSHAKWYRGGQNYPSWDLLALFNNHALGEMLEVETIEVPRRDLAEVRKRIAVDDAPLVGAYATRDDDRLAVIVTSRRVPDYPVSGDDGRTAVEIDLPIDGAADLTLYRLSGRYDAHNVSEQQVAPVTEYLPVPDDPARLAIPSLEPGQTLIYVYSGVTS